MAPKLACGEPDGVNVLRFFAGEMRVGIGKDVDAVIAIDRADVIAGVAGQARVADRVDVQCTDTLAGRESRR